MGIRLRDILFQEQTYEPELCRIIFVYRVVLDWPNKSYGTNDFAFVIISTIEHQHGIGANNFFCIRLSQPVRYHG